MLFVALFVACVLLGWWQLDRAEGGNGLSWAYTFEWPLFALFTLFFWWKTTRFETAEKPEPVQAEPVREEIVVSDEEDPTMAAYNRYLAQLHAADQQRAR